jgi:hypothetical protein
VTRGKSFPAEAVESVAVESREVLDTAWSDAPLLLTIVQITIDWLQESALLSWTAVAPHASLALRGQHVVMTASSREPLRSVGRSARHRKPGTRSMDLSDRAQTGIDAAAVGVDHLIGAKERVMPASAARGTKVSHDIDNGGATLRVQGRLPDA